MTAAINPTFEPPNGDDSDHEIWLLRAPAAVDVSALLNGVTLDVDPQSLLSPSAAAILSKFKSDDSEYTLTQGDATEVDNLRLLVPDTKSASSDDDENNELLIPYHRPFQRQIHLTSVLTCPGGSGDVKEDLALAPSTDAAPKPAMDQSGNGAVDRMRLAYVPVAQRQGLKRRWAMPGSKIKEAAPSALYSSPKKKARSVGDDMEVEVEAVAGSEAVVSDDEPQQKEVVPKSSSKKAKKDKKKKEKKSKKSSKK